MTVELNSNEGTSERFKKIKQTLLLTPIYLCTERARLITRHFKKADNASDPLIQINLLLRSMGLIPFSKLQVSLLTGGDASSRFGIQIKNIDTPLLAAGSFIFVLICLLFIV